MSKKVSIPLATAGLAAAALLIVPVKGSTGATAGSLMVVARDGQPLAECPLKHTSVNAEISGFLARVNVVQEFENTSGEKVEAVYTFPLPHNAAVDEMTMQIGDRTIRGAIKRREEARQIYEQARMRGNVASLLDQERPNIFTQQVANIVPGAKVKITISYVETLKYEEGSYEFSFPMVVGPRYIPAGVSDAARITPPVTPQGTRAGHDISLAVKLDAGVPIDNLNVASHEVVTQRPSAHEAVISLKSRAVLPNKDFVLKYDVAGRKIQDSVLTHNASRGGFFTLILQPPDRVTEEDVTPKELVFLLDTSGSMSGFPIEKAKETMQLAMAGLYPRDTFNLITFSGDTHILFPQPVPATKENLRVALEFLDSRRGGGGTEMMRAIRAALDPSDAQDHLRIVCFMTDGYVGNDNEIISEVRRHPNARVFAFGIGTAVNRYLLDGIAREGRGEVEYVSLKDDGSAAARRFHERVRNPLLTDVSVDFGGLPVADVYPKRIPDLFSAKPVIVTGRYSGAARGTIRLSGKMSGRAIMREIPLNLPASQPRHDVLATLWARTRIGELSSEGAAAKEEITQLGLTYRLMTQYTSFVAVEETTITEGGVPRRVEVPIEMPEGVSYEGVFGPRQEQAAYKSMAMPGVVGGVVGGIVSNRAFAPPAPPAPQEIGVRADIAVETPRRSMVYRVDARIAVVMKLVVLGKPLDADSRKFVRGGKAYVEIWLDDTSAEMRKRLKQAGFELTEKPRTAKVLTGCIAVDKLDALSRLEGVHYVTPHML